MTAKTPIYLDYAATCPVDQRVVDAMLPYFTQSYGNAASRTHAFGWVAEEAVEAARGEIAQTIGADAKEITWTSGATESNNLAIKGVAEYLAEQGNHIITVVTEHKAVLDTCKYLERHGCEVTYLPVDAEGLVTPQQVADAITDKTILVSVMFANNETGVIQPIAEIGKVCRAKQGPVPHRRHAGVRQSAARRRRDEHRSDEHLGAQDLRAQGHRRAVRPSPQAAGAARPADPWRRPRARQSLGHAQRAVDRRLRYRRPHRPRGHGRRGGAHPLACATTCATACSARSNNVFLNGSREHVLPGHLNISFAYIEGESLLMALKDVALSSGSACTSASLEPSYVLRAMGLDDELAHSSLRMTIGRFTTKAELDHVADELREQVPRLREMSPLWEMVQDGIDLDSIQWAAH